ncbi:helicase [Lactococcus hodotermopsidis]|uniref:Helicase n=2 Tax=Pseudolactococcus hodotermopsidis TaxID=2709157 RepID=A0A6A0B7R1_9LACT|nr:helicase [Lactococcus hodotermopsidis]
MPARIRAEGAEIFEKGLMTNVSFSEMKLMADVDGEQVVYDLDGQNDLCFCDVFQHNKRYCKHIAAIEEYLKKADSDTVEEEKKAYEAEVEKSNELQESAAFLAKINDEKWANTTENLSLEVDVIDGESMTQFYRQGDFLVFTLKIRLSNTLRPYIIKDIPQFIELVRKSETYLIGSSRYVSLVMSRFDAPSQAFLKFLLKITPNSEEIVLTNLFRKTGRYLIPQSGLIPELLALIMPLRFSMKLSEKTIKYFSVLPLTDESDLYRFYIKPLDDVIELSVKRDKHLSFFEGEIIYADHVFYTLDSEQLDIAKQISHLPTVSDDLKVVHFDYDDKDKLAQALQIFEKIGYVDAPESFKIRRFKPTFKFDMARFLTLKIAFDYGDFQITTFQDLETVGFSRDLRLEKQIFDLLKRVGFSNGFESKIDRPQGEAIYEFFTKVIPEFAKLGDVTLSEVVQSLQVTENFDIDVDQNGGLLDISFDLPHVPEKEFSKLVNRLQSHAAYYVTGDGRLIMLDEQFDPVKRVLDEMADTVQVADGKITVPAFKTFQLSKIFDETDTVSFSDKFDKLYTDLTHPHDFPYEKPQNISAELRPYQEDGVRWMNMLSSYYMGGVLADDMGLGKTLQSITYLAGNLKVGEKALIVSPSSLVYNWLSEFEKFAPDLSVVVVDGSADERGKLRRDKKAQIFITSYGSFLKDEHAYQYLGLKYLFMDEAQTVKNFNSKTNKALARLKVDHIFALSGTPIENRVDEIWAIFQIIMPGILGDRKTFRKLKHDAIARMIQPFIMRRRKEEVLLELPDKLEMIQYNELDEAQKIIYLAQLEAIQSRVRSMNDYEFSRSKIEILAGITRLRQICDTPALFMSDYKGTSGKLKSLAELLQQIKDSGHRPLIFSQFRKMFPFIEKQLEEAGISSYQLTGSTPTRDRMKMVKAFNAGSRDAFLISLKAGGTGLNLTSADVVILIDLWWNPSVEEQAISRAHRMGQTKTVEVIRLITRGTIEEKIMSLQDTKRDMVTTVLDGGANDTAISEDEMKTILGI